MSKNIPACVMAGGKGTRLRPLTSDTPKPLVKLLGKPIIEYIFELLRQHGVAKTKVAVGYHSQKLQSHFEQYNKLALEFVKEEIPLGTAGAVKNAMRDETDDFIVMSGDAMCDTNLSAAVAFHKQSGAMATIVCTRVCDPREYGLVLCNDSGRVGGFLEKPSYQSCSCDLASTGIYILSPAVLKLVQDDTFTDFACDVFPQMLKQEMPIFAYEDSGYWCDIGDTKSYVKCQQDMLCKKVVCTIDAKEMGGVYYKSGEHNERNAGNHDGEITAPAYIGEGVTVGVGSRISGCVIGDNATIGQGSVISGSVLLDSVYIGENVTMSGSICCERVCFENGASALDGSVIGSGAVVAQDAVVCDNVKVWANKVVPANVTLNNDLMMGTAKDINIDEDGITGQTNIKITPELCVKIGSSVASIKPGGIIGVAYNRHQSSLCLYYAVLSGIMAAGGTAWGFGECIVSQAEFCFAKSMAEFGVYIDGGSISTIRLFEKGGLSTCRSVERKLEGGINRGEFKRIVAQKIGTTVDMTSLVKLYQIELMKQCDTALDGISVTVKCYDKQAKSLLENTLTALGCDIGEGITVCIKQGGGVLIYDVDTTITTQRALCLLCLGEFMHSQDVYIPQTSPMIIDQIAADYKARAFRYASCPSDANDSVMRQKAIQKPFLRDELMMVIKLFSFMKARGVSLKVLNQMVPEFEILSRLVPIRKAPSVVIKGMDCGKTPLSEGVMLEKNGHLALIRPMKSGAGIMIFSEVVHNLQSETAAEICDEFEEIIRRASTQGDGA